MFHSLSILNAVHGRRVDLRDLARGRAPVSQDLDLELAQAHVKHLEQPRLSRVEDLALLADDIRLALAVLVAEDNLALDHARGDTQAAQLGLEGVLERNVVLGGDLAGGGVDDARGDGEAAGGDGAGARKVDERQVVKVFQDRLDGAVGQDQADVAAQVLGQALDAGRDGLFRGLAEGLGHELCLAKEESRERKKRRVSVCVQFPCFGRTR